MFLFLLEQIMFLFVYSIHYSVEYNIQFIHTSKLTSRISSEGKIDASLTLPQGKKSTQKLFLMFSSELCHTTFWGNFCFWLLQSNLFYFTSDVKSKCKSSFDYFLWCHHQIGKYNIFVNETKMNEYFLF